MPGRCENVMSSFRSVSYKEPRKLPSTLHPAWRCATMHLKPYPKFQKELHLESIQDSARGVHAGQQRVLRIERAVHQSCPVRAVPGSVPSSRRPLGVIFTNMLCGNNSSNSNPTPKVCECPPNGPWDRKGKAPPVSALTSSLLLLSSMPDKGDPLTLYQGDSGDAHLDIWAVIKPGNTKEKIAIFAAQQCGHNGVGTGGGDGPASRTLSMKIKGCWEVEGSLAKRRKCSSDPDKPGGLGQWPPQGGSGGEQEVRGEKPHDEAVQQACRGEGEVEFKEEKSLSVVEMVAYLEQRASDQQLDCAKYPPLRSSSSVTPAKAGPMFPVDQAGVPEALEVREEEGESVRVLEMVARLESECLKRQCEREASGALSRSNSLRRSVGRVLLARAGPEACSRPPSLTRDVSYSILVPHTDGPSSPLAHCGMAPSGMAGAISETEMGSLASLCPCEPVVSPCGIQSAVPRTPGQQERRGDGEEGGGMQMQGEEAKAGGETCAKHREEPPPGMLFFSLLQEQHPAPNADTTPTLPQDSLSPYPLFRREGQNVKEEADVDGEGETEALGQERAQFPLRRLVSHEFLETRFKIQLLLEPQQYMALLPHHIMVKIFSFLPTQALAALKCTCHYFKFIIESYGVRPADSRWVCDPRYKDDPCKQCKKRYGRGDVSLCRWHHKPYCQALPYGPGYWMCCHGSHKDTPGCNVGLHDNRWVPAFHSKNMPIYKKARESEEDS
ncbi:F-box only protein 34 [Megalops cyprinoides]|uniref:F-box only protein 34 n=1 Tax=Megalops cyprinoides TaxID=118141 RepID=UPI0018642DFC|nr:F-box only protein 34 [Megalops cyprinoides]